jgi:hypothetical protein
MTIEFDETSDPSPHGRRPRSAEMPVARTSMPVPRLVARLYAAANIPLRARLIACLLRPLGPLALAGVAAGAFAGFLNRHGSVDASVDLERAARVSSEQVLELAHFVEQVNPEAFQRFAELVSGSSLGLATFSASALVLLYRALRDRMATHSSASHG